MRWSKFYLHTLRENPADAELSSHQLLVRAGLIKKVSSGVFTYGPLALRAIRRLEAIIREEHEKVGAVEVLMPAMHPKELWEETERWSKLHDILFKLKDRNGQEHCLGGTHEEVITQHLRGDVQSYKDLPVLIYQIQTKFRNEIRPRFGLMRGREFSMKDAYSFDLDKETALQAYETLRQVYTAIFTRLGIEFRSVKADSGGMGGDHSQEFHALAAQGEDQLMVSNQSDFAANVEVCPTPEGKASADTALQDLEEFATPQLRTIEDLAKSLKCKDAELVKSLFCCTADPYDPKAKIKPITVLVRGDHELNLVKLKNYLGLSYEPRLLNDDEVRTLTGASPGSCGPVGLKTPIYTDHSLKGFSNFVVGANKDDFHLKNVNFKRDFEVTQYADLRTAVDGDPSPDGKGQLQSIRGIEVGHIFYLGTGYSESMGLKYLDQNGKQQPVHMGCYGIGVTRTMQAVVEQSHDEDGIIWPKAVAPFDVHICHLDPEDEELDQKVDEWAEQLQKKGLEVFIDDRKGRPGVKFKDADLLGFPVRVVIGRRGFDNDEIEVVFRRTKEVQKVSTQKVIDHVEALLKDS